MAKSFEVKGSISDYARNTVIEEKGVLARIKDWDFAKDEDQTIVLELTIETGTKKGSTQKDFVTFDSTSKMNWKYASVRDAIGEPITANDSFDLLKLVGRYVIVDLVPSKNGKYQNLNYKKYSENLVENMVSKLSKETPAPTAKAVKVVKPNDSSVEVKDDDLPF